jgi:hypothetical protein
VQGRRAAWVRKARDVVDLSWAEAEEESVSVREVIV